MWKVFDFQCLDCEHVFEDMVKNDDPPVCKECGSENTERMMSSPLVGSMNDPVKRNATLKKRAEAHTASQQRKGNLPTAQNYHEFKKK